MAMDAERRQAELIAQFSAQAAALSSAPQLAALVLEATSHPALFAFSELLTLPALSKGWCKQSIGNNSGYLCFEDSKAARKARMSTVIADEGGLIIEDHIVTLEPVTGMGCSCAGGRPAQGGSVQDPPHELPQQEDPQGDLIGQLQAPHRPATVCYQRSYTQVSS